MNGFAIETRNLNYVYSPKTPFENEAIKEINLKVKKNSFTCIIGHTGCGKSTLIQHFNGLLKPSSGEIYISGSKVTGKGLKELRQKVGLVFQYPEHQLFEETVYKDIAFGLNRRGDSAETMDAAVKRAIKAVGLSESFLERSIYELSGGEKRRVAIAGVIVMQPEILILDEPTAGLDPRGRDEIFDMIYKYHREAGVTILLVSHSMEDVAKLADSIIVMNHGRIELEGTPAEVFQRKAQLEQIGLAVPQITSLMERLHHIHPGIKRDCVTIEEALSNLLTVLKGEEDAE